jgi:hypothetical protein
VLDPSGKSELDSMDLYEQTWFGVRYRMISRSEAQRQKKLCFAPPHYVLQKITRLMQAEWIKRMETADETDRRRLFHKSYILSKLNQGLGKELNCKGKLLL